MIFHDYFIGFPYNGIVLNFKQVTPKVGKALPYCAFNWRAWLVLDLLMLNYMEDLLPKHEKMVNLKTIYLLYRLSLPSLAH